MPRKSNNSKNAYKPATGATKPERGEAAQIREEFWVPKPVRQKLNAIVDEKNKDPTKIEMPKRNDGWKPKKSWQS